MIPEAQGVEDDVPADGPHAVLEECSPSLQRLLVPCLLVPEQKTKSAGEPDQEGNKQGQADLGRNKYYGAEQQLHLLYGGQVEAVCEAVLLCDHVVVYTVLCGVAR